MYVASLFYPFKDELALKLHMWMLVNRTSTPMFSGQRKFQHIVVVLERDNMLILSFMTPSMRVYHVDGLFREEYLVCHIRKPHTSTTPLSMQLRLFSCSMAVLHA